VPISTTAFGYMPHQLHRLWADAIVVEWKQSQDKPVGLTDSEGNWENRMRMALDSMKGSNLDRAIIASVPDDDGQNY